MAAPNLTALTAVLGRTAHVALIGSVTDIVTAVPTNHAYHVQAIFCANKTSAQHPVTVFHKAGGTSYEIAYQMLVPGNATLNVLDGKVLWLEEGDSLTGLSDAGSQIVVVVSYEDMA